MTKSLAILLFALCAGCSSLARGGAASLPSDAGEDDEDHLGALPVTPADRQAPPPGQMSVSWEDNGIPIRQLTPEGAPYEMKVPAGHPKKATVTGSAAAPATQKK